MKTKTRAFRFNLVAVCLLLLTPSGRDAKAEPFPIATNPILVEFSAGIAFGGTNYLIAMTAGTNVTVQLVSSKGELYGPPVNVGTNAGFPPDVAVVSGQTNYLVAWSDYSVATGVSMFGQFVTRGGDKFGPCFSLLGTQGSHGFQALSKVASDGTNFLAVWQDTTSKGLYGQLVTAAGELPQPEFLIGSQQKGHNNNTVAFGKTNYLVVWQSGPGPFDTFGCLVSLTGSNGTPFQISQTTSESYNPLAIAFDGTNYLVVWNRDIGPGGPSAPIWDLYGRPVSQSGTFPSNELTLVNDPGNQWIPAVAFDGSNYLLAWTDMSSSITNTMIRFRFFDPAGSPVGQGFAPYTDQGTNAPLFAFNGLVFGGSQFASAATLGALEVDANGNFVGLLSGDVYGAFLPASSAPPRLAVTGPRVGTQFPLLLTGTPGMSYAITAGMALAATNWTALVTNSPTIGTFSFIDNAATNATRFYRAVKR